MVKVEPLIFDDVQDLDVLYQVAIGVRETLERMTSGRLASTITLPGKIETQLEWNRAFLPDYCLLPASDLHRWACERADRARRQRGQKTNILGARGSAKSVNLTLAYPLRCALEGWEPLIWIVSETGDQANEQLEHIKSEIEHNEIIAHAYPHAAGKGPLWREDKIRLRNGVGIQAFGKGRKLRGRRQRASRPTLIISDDLQSDAVITSPNQRDKDRAWFHGALLKAGTPRTNVFNLATALHRDAVGSELGRTPGWESKTFPSIIEWPKRMDLWEEWCRIYHDVENPAHKENARAFYDANRKAMDEGAVVLWPELEDLYTLMCMREEGGRTAFEREKQCRPINPEQCEWPEEYFGDHIWFERWPENLIVKTMALDPSKGKNDKIGDYQACIRFGVDRHDVLYFQAHMARQPIPQMVADCVDIYGQFKPQAFGVEANAWQDLLAPDFSEEFKRQGILAPDVWQMTNSVSKQVRIRRLGGYLSSHRMRFKSNCAHTRLLVEQLRDFPIGDHDDGPDGAEMAVRLGEELVARSLTKRETEVYA